MTNALNDLRLRWRERERMMKADVLSAIGDIGKSCREQELKVHQRCITELIDTVDSVKPRPLNEASTEKLYRWADRMVVLLDLAARANVVREESPDAEHTLAQIGWDLGKLGTRDFLNDVYDLFKQLSNRGTA